MTTIASQITSLTVVYSTVYSDANQRKHQSSASLAFVWGIHRDRWNPRTKGQLRGKCFHLMTSSCKFKLWNSHLCPKITLVKRHHFPHSGKNNLDGKKSWIFGSIPHNTCNVIMQNHGDIINWKHFSRYWPFVRAIHRPPVTHPHQGQWRRALMFDLRLNKRLSKQSWGWWFETPSPSLWRHCNVLAPSDKDSV